MADGASSRRALVIGIGNPDRGDDAVGRIVAQRLRGEAPPGTQVIEHDGETGALIDGLAGFNTVYLIDAMMSGRPPGTVDRFDVTATPLPRADCGTSTHGLDLSAAIELARALDKLPQNCVVYTIEAQNFDIGAPLSPAVAAAAGRLVADILAEIGIPQGSVLT